jgi:hypothetical protein
VCQEIELVERIAFAATPTKKLGVDRIGWQPMTRKRLRACEGESESEITAPNGVVWIRRAGGKSTGTDLLEALEDLRVHGDVSQRWDWWQDDRREQEHDRIWQIIGEWDNGAPGREYTVEEAEAVEQAELDRIDKSWKTTGSAGLTWWPRCTTRIARTCAFGC